jgi:hypothetical protein
MLPSRAKPLGIELPRAVILIPRLCERLAGHFAIRVERHLELSAAWRGGGERLAIEEGRSDVAGRHGLRCKGRAREKEYAGDGKCSYAHPRISSHNNGWLFGYLKPFFAGYATKISGLLSPCRIANGPQLIKCL